MSIYAESLAEYGIELEPHHSREAWQQAILKPETDNGRPDNLQPTMLPADSDENRLAAVALLGIQKVDNEVVRQVLLSRYKATMESLRSPGPYAYRAAMSEPNDIDRLNAMEEQVIALGANLMADKGIGNLLRSDDSKRNDATIERAVSAMPYQLNEVLSAMADHLPEDIFQRAHDAMQFTAIRPADPLVILDIDYEDEFPPDDACALEATYSGLFDEVLLNTDYCQDPQKIVELLLHELIHKMSGGTFAPAPFANGPNSYRLRNGFTSGFEMHPQREALNEAVTDYVTAALLAGSIEDVRSTEHAKTSPYSDLITLLEIFIERSEGVITPKLLMEAFFEDTEPGKTPTARRALIAAVRQSYGPGALKKLDWLMCADAPLEKRLECITPGKIISENPFKQPL